MRPTLELELRWQPRQVRSVSIAASLAGCRMSLASALSTCLAPGPWHDSQAWAAQPRDLFVSTEKCGVFVKRAAISSWHILQASEPAYPGLSAGAGAAAASCAAAGTVAQPRNAAAMTASRRAPVRMVSSIARAPFADRENLRVVDSCVAGENSFAGQDAVMGPVPSL